MKATVVECVMGVFGFGENNELVDAVLFPKDPVKAAERLAGIEAGRVVDELAKLVENLRKKGYEAFVFESSRMASSVRERLDVEVDVVQPSEAGEMLRGNLDKIAVDVGFIKRPEEIRAWIHRVSMELTKMRVKKATEKRDLVVIQAIQTLDDLDKTLNLFAGRVREWYGLHFPELSRLVAGHETYNRLVNSLGRRENFTVENLEEEGLPKAKAEETARAAQRSMGSEMEDRDLDQIRAICNHALGLYKVRNSLEGYVDSTMEEVAPNIRALGGPLLGARLIAIAGGLNNLAKMPASTVQVLGAEKALFRSLKSGASPPKHGVIFQHSSLQEAKRWQRGKVARTLAGKLAIAARIDAFSGGYRGDELREDLERRIGEIRERYRKPPSRKGPARRPSRRGKRGRKG